MNIRTQPRVFLYFIDEHASNDATVSSADEESSQGEMTIHLPGAPVTADLQMEEPEQMDEDSNWSDSGIFHGFTPDEIDEPVTNAEIHRYIYLNFTIYNY